MAGQIRPLVIQIITVGSTLVLEALPLLPLQVAAAQGHLALQVVVAPPEDQDNFI